MRALGLQFDRVLASPAMRVRETLEEVARAYGAPLGPEFDQRSTLPLPKPCSILPKAPTTASAGC
jgi:phosphohistidine phosphatase SixA